MKFGSLHWGFVLVILAAAILLGNIATDKYLSQKATAPPVTG